MVISNLDIEGIAVLPAETNPVLVIDSDAVLSGTISLQGLQTVRRRRCQIAKLLRAIDLNQAAYYDRGDLLETPDAATLYAERESGVAGTRGKPGARALSQRL